MKWLIATMLLCLALAGTVYGSQQAANSSSGCIGCDSGSANVTENQAITQIFIQEGSGGSYAKDSAGNYNLTMTNAVPYTIYFADRPARDVGFVPMDKFIKGFNFMASNPPNAAIILPEENETSDMVIVEPTSPQYDNTTDTLIYKARQLKEYSFKSGWLDDQKNKVDDLIPERFGRIVLIIDGCPCLKDTSGCPKCRNSCWSSSAPGCVACGGCCDSGYWCKHGYI